MRRTLLFFLCLCVYLMARGQTNAFSYRYWFDQESESYVGKSTVPLWNINVDVSAMKEGLHSLHIQVEQNDTLSVPLSHFFIKMPPVASIGFVNCLFWVDGKLFSNEQVASTNGAIAWNVDVSSLQEGLHQYIIQTMMPSGVCSDMRTGSFLYTTQTDVLNEMRCYYIIDRDETTTAEAESISNGVYHFNLDVSQISEGLHQLNYWLAANDGTCTSIKTAFFTKIPLGGEGTTRYQYWLNNLEEQKREVVLGERQDPFNLLTLLPVETQPIRSSNFQFAIKDGEPLIYAKNEIHFRFFDAAGRFTETVKEYYDEQMIGKLEPIGELQETQMFEKVPANSIRWYTVQAEEGDSLAFKLNCAATLQLFSPSCEELFKASGSSSVVWDGCHVEENGTYYFAVHDVTSQQVANMVLDYQHIDRYAVLRQDVAVVGNQGYSTITFNGNGFNELTNLYLVLESDTIPAIEFEHESNAVLSAKFYFEDATLGSYKALFKFTDGELLVDDCIVVEEATDIDIDVAAIFNRNDLISFHKTKYIFSVHNNGNVTAYDVPLMIRVYTHNDESLNRVVVEGYDLASNFIELLGEHYSDSLSREIERKRAVSGDRCFFLESDSTDIVAGWAAHVHQCFVFPTIPPNSTKDIVVSLELGQAVYCYMWHPEEWDDEAVVNAQHKVKKKAKISGGCKKTAFIHESICEQNALSIQNGGQAIYNEDCRDYAPYPMKCPGDGGGSAGAGSRDPNDIFGFQSEAGSKYITDSIKTLDYGIEFENDSTFATASAHIVVVRDTLDSQLFDLSSFTPIAIKIGDREVRLNGSPHFVTTIDMRPEINVIAQVEGSYNQAKGIAEWRFTSLDPMTMEPTEDFMSGFLPVNYDGTSGIGKVFFEINMKQKFVDGTEISNRASIIFDGNEAILTPTWVNTVDAVAPVSTIRGGIQTNDSTLTLRLAGEDARSGVWKYNVYAQFGAGTSWELVAENVTDTLCDVRIYEDIDYSFCVLATDSAGNVEKKVFSPEFSLSSDLLGDANGDGSIDLTDAIMITYHSLGAAQPGLNLNAADVNRDGVVDLTDAITVVYRSLGTENGGAGQGSGAEPE